MRRLFPLLLMIALLGCSDEKADAPKAPPSDTEKLVALQQTLAKTVHSNATKCNRLVEEVDAFFAEHGAELKALGDRAAGGEMKAGGKLWAKNQEAVRRLSVDTMYCKQMSPKAKRALERHGL